jgi:hypothetical protein
MSAASAPSNISGTAPLRGDAPPSPAGPALDEETPLLLPPALRLPRIAQTLRFTVRNIEFVFRARR